MQLEAITTSCLDEIIFLRDHKFKVTLIISIFFFCASSIMCTNVSTNRLENHQLFLKSHSIEFRFAGRHIYIAAIGLVLIRDSCNCHLFGRDYNGGIYLWHRYVHDRRWVHVGPATLCVLENHLEIRNACGHAGKRTKNNNIIYTLIRSILHSSLFQ